MFKNIATVLIACLLVQISSGQIILSANGEGNTYEDINAVLAPNYDIVEVPDCAHSNFGRHIDEIFDKDLNTYVFRFIAHVNQDNDRCKKFDRQRVEIKTYSKSPDNLKAVKGEIVEYKWKFKLPNNFSVSKNFTHLHQIKSVGSQYSSKPIISLTARKGSPDRLELRFAPTDEQSTLKSVELDLIRSHWVEVTEIIEYADKGSYSIEIKKVSNGSKLFEYTNDSMDMWQDGSDFFRPKWGIYRSLKHKEDIKDEEVLFNDFSIEEIPALNLETLEKKAELQDESLVNKNQLVNLKSIKPNDYDNLKIYDFDGQELSKLDKTSKNKLNVSELKTGDYFIVFEKSKRAIKVIKFKIN